MIADFSDDVFEHKTKGEILLAMMKVATGHRIEGLKLLEAYIEKTAARKCKRKGINTKT